MFCLLSMKCYRISNRKFGDCWIGQSGNNKWLARPDTSRSLLLEKIKGRSMPQKTNNQTWNARTYKENLLYNRYK